jgi:Holliday junction resolvase-like predicted endonuclease
MIKASNTTNFRHSLGRMGESIAEDFLVTSTWAIEARNFYAHRLGEIDIIARPPGGQALAFIEVKTRRVSSFAQQLDHPGQEAMHTKKQQRLRRAALTYISTSAAYAPVLRFDLILVDIALNFRDVEELLSLKDMAALRRHSKLTHLVNIMGTF